LPQSINRVQLPGERAVGEEFMQSLMAGRAKVNGLYAAFGFRSQVMFRDAGDLALAQRASARRGMLQDYLGPRIF
jgi:hypothetical protein